MPVAQKLAQGELFRLGCGLVVERFFFSYRGSRESGRIMKLKRMEGSRSFEKVLR